MFPDVSSMLVLGQASGDDPVKDAAQKVQPLSRFSLTMLSCTKCPEILRRLWHHMREELKNDLAFTAVRGGNIAVAQTSTKPGKKETPDFNLLILFRRFVFCYSKTQTGSLRWANNNLCYFRHQVAYRLPIKGDFHKNQGILRHQKLGRVSNDDRGSTKRSCARSIRIMNMACYPTNDATVTDKGEGTGRKNRGSLQ